MKAQQIAFPFHRKRLERLGGSNIDLTGRWYEDDCGRVIVVGLQRNREGYVILRRTQNGNMFEMPAWLVRLILMEKRWKRAA